MENPAGMIKAKNRLFRYIIGHNRVMFFQGESGYMYIKFLKVQLLKGFSPRIICLSLTYQK